MAIKNSVSPATANIDRKTVTKQLTIAKLAEAGRGSNFTYFLINSCGSRFPCSSGYGLPDGDNWPLKGAELHVPSLGGWGRMSW